jgi:hypothetical protein
MTVHDLMAPRPLTAVNTKSGELLWQWGQLSSGGCENVSHREQRGSART